VNTRSKLNAAWLPLGLLVSASVVAQAPAVGQPPVAPRDAEGPAPFYDPAQLPSFNGKVQQFTLSPRGEIDGLILSDGTEVKTPPHLSTSIAYAIKPGDAVTIHGLRAAAIPLLQATSITDHTSGRTIVDAGPGPRPEGPRQISRTDAAGVVEVQGAIRMSLHGARGEINGILLADGTVLRLPPDAASNMGSLLQPGRVIVAQGDELSNPIGRVLEVRAIGSSRTDLTPIDSPPPPGPRGRPWGPRPDAPSPPPSPPGAG
jgi:hypothetical protein